MSLARLWRDSAASARTARSGIWVVHGGVRHARSEGGEGAAGGVGVTRRRERLLSQFRERRFDPREDRSLAELGEYALRLVQMLDRESGLFPNLSAMLEGDAVIHGPGQYPTIYKRPRIISQRPM